MRFLIDSGKARLGRFTILMAVVALGFAALGIAPTRAWASHDPLMSPDLQKIEASNGQNAEIAFMNMMINHHQGALDMGQLALSRSNRQEIKAIAQQMIDSQSADKQKMIGWLQQWYGLAPEPPSPGMQQRMTMDMTKLQSLTGDDFDREWLLTFRMHHTTAIEASTLLLPRAVHPELKDLAQKTIDSQVAERQQFVTWLQQWFNLSVPASPGPGEAGGATGGQPVGMPSTGAGDSVQTAFMLALLAMAAGGLMLGGHLLRKRA